MKVSLGGSLGHLFIAVKCKNRQITTGVKLSYHLLAALSLIIVHSIYIGQIVWGCQLPSLMHMHKHKGGVACVQ